jgi:hypothetical protein
MAAAFSTRTLWMTTRRLLVALGLVLTTLSLVGTAHAQDQKAIAKARQKFRQAISMQTGGNWAAALGLFREVAAVKNTPQVQFNIAICEENLGQLVQALGDYQLAAAQAREEGKPDVAAEVDSRLGTLQERIPKIVIKRGKNAGIAKLSIDGLEVGSAMVDKKMPVDPGTHIVEAKSRGYEPYEKQLDAAEGEVVEVVVDLVALPEDAPEPAAGGGGDVTADKGAAPPKDEGTNLLPFIVGGAGVAALAAGGTFYLLALSADSELKDKCPNGTCPSDDPTLPDVKSKRDLYGLISPIAAGVGVVGIGVGVVLLLTGGGSSSDDGSDSARSVHFSVGSAGSLAGATVSGKF